MTVSISCWTRFSARRAEAGQIGRCYSLRRARMACKRDRYSVRSNRVEISSACQVGQWSVESGAWSCGACLALARLLRSLSLLHPRTIGFVSSPPLERWRVHPDMSPRATPSFEARMSLLPAIVSALCFVSIDKQIRHFRMNVFFEQKRTSPCFVAFSTVEAWRSGKWSDLSVFDQDRLRSQAV